MAGFDPDAPSEVVGSGGFNPDAPSEVVAKDTELHPGEDFVVLKPQEEAPPSKFSSFVHGLANGATLGAGHKISGAASMLADVPSNMWSAAKNAAQDHPNDLLGGIGGMAQEIYGKYLNASAGQAKDYAAAKEANPVTYGAGDLVGNIGATAPIAAALPVAGAAKGWKAMGQQGAQLGALSSIAASDQDASGAAKEALVGGALGGAFGAAGDVAANALANPVIRGARAAGKALQVPQKLYEGVAERIGKTKLGQKVGGYTADVADMAGDKASRSVQALRKIISSDELGAKNALAQEATEGAVSGIADKRLAQLTTDERRKTAEALAAQMTKMRGDAGGNITPERVESALDNLVANAGKDPRSVTVRDIVRMANKRDYGYASAQTKSVRDFLTQSGLVPEDALAADVAQMGRSAEAASDAIRSGQVSRYGTPGTPPTGGRAQVPVSELENAARGVSDTVPGYRPANDGTPIVDMNKPIPEAMPQAMPESDSFDPSLMQRYQQAGTAENASWMAAGKRPSLATGEDIRQMSAQDPMVSMKYLRDIQPQGASKWSASIPHSQTDFVPSEDGGKLARGFDAEYSDWMTKNRDKLAHIATGRAALDSAGNKAMQLGGAGMMMGLPGAGTPVALAGLLQKGGKLADKAGAWGRKLEDHGTTKLQEKIAASAGNPFELKRLQTMGGELAGRAQSVLDAPTEAAKNAQSFVLSLTPEFRQYVKQMSSDDDR